MNPLVRLGALGQSPWYDFITRDLLRSGTLQRLIEEDGLRGMTSNPTIFQKAVAGSPAYDDDIRRLAGQGLSAPEVAEQIMVTDVQEACDHFLPVYHDAGGHDGLVSLEVSPSLAYDAEGTVEEAGRLWEAIDRPNAMIKIPGTAAGLPAIASALASGINVNVTLLFSVERYRAVLEAFLTGLEQRLEEGGAIDRIASVASFFVSRVDTQADRILTSEAPDRQAALGGTAAIANAAAAYAVFREVSASKRWAALAGRGGRIQRPLWASTSTKNPAYSDVYYVEALIGPLTVNTLPPATFDAYRDHGDPRARIFDEVTAAPGRIEALRQAGVDLERIAGQLETEGVESFADSHASLLAVVEAKAGALTSL